jgi:hypothetical protein
MIHQWLFPFISMPLLYDLTLMLLCSLHFLPFNVFNWSKCHFPHIYFVWTYLFLCCFFYVHNTHFFYAGPITISPLLLIVVPLVFFSLFPNFLLFLSFYFFFTYYNTKFLAQVKLVRVRSTILINFHPTANHHSFEDFSTQCFQLHKSFLLHMLNHIWS